MTASEMVRSALAEAGKTQRELAEFMGWSPQNLSGRLKNDTLTFDELNKALGFFGYSVKMVSRTGDEIPSLATAPVRRSCRWWAVSPTTPARQSPFARAGRPRRTRSTWSFSKTRQAPISWPTISFGRAAITPYPPFAKAPLRSSGPGIADS